MNVFFPKSATKRLDAKLAFIKGKGSQKLADAIAGEIAEGNDRDRLEGLDRYGRPLAPVKPRQGRYAGASGPPLAPFGAGSRVVSLFRSQRFGRPGAYRIVAGWEGFVSKAGFPILLAHEEGVRSRHGRASKPPDRGGIFARVFRRIKLATVGGWFLPRRPVMGISPRTWRKIRGRIDEFKRGFKKAR